MLHLIKKGGENEMNEITSWQVVLVESWRQVWYSFAGVLPNVLGAILIFAIGLVIASWVRKGLIKAFEIGKLDVVSKKLGLDEIVKKGHMEFTLTTLIASLAKWLVISVFFLAAVNLLGLGVVSDVLVAILGYFPNIFAAALIVGAGYFVANLVEGLVKGALASVDHGIAKPISRVAKWVILVSAIFAAIDQLQIAKGLVATFFQGLTYTLVLAIGLSVGLGAKDLVSKILSDWYEKVKK
ncbi:MAG: hypothetical protein Q8P91_02575 [bacterium]|nr:hypothetical protein [bacterium]